MLSEYQLKITDLYNIAIGNVKKLMPKLFDKKICHSSWRPATLLETRIKNKKIHHVSEFNQSEWLKPYIEFNT